MKCYNRLVLKYLPAMNFYQEIVHRKKISYGIIKRLAHLPSQMIDLYSPSPECLQITARMQGKANRAEAH